jgi:parallel beta-helix repeat protein
VVKLKKAILVLFLILFLSSAPSMARNAVSVGAGPVMINVFPATHPTIQEAINSANPGDLIFVHRGIYYEDLVVNKSVSLVGEDRDLTVIYGYANQSDYVVFVIASGTSVKDLTVRRNPVNLFGGGIFVGSVGNVILHNKIEDSYYGLMISSSNNNDVSDNIISNNTNGLTLTFSSNNVFSNNIISDNSEKGISLWSSNGNLFLANTVVGNMDGIQLFSSGGNNVFYHNSFNNTVQLLSDSTNSTNVWSQNGEGNYWSDYRGQDSNNDGIGNSPYSTDTNNSDNYPLMGIFYDLEVVLKNQTYFINLVCNSTVSDLRFEFGQETGNRIVSFNAAGEEGTTGFCRIMVPIGLMEPPLIVLSSEGEITPALLSASNETDAYLYFTWAQSNQTVSIVSSQTSRLYNELLDEYSKLLGYFNSLNATDYSFLENYSILLNSLRELQDRYTDLNDSYYKHLVDYSRNVENLQNLMYVFAATTAIFLVTTVYLSKRAHASRESELSKTKNSTY